MRSLVLAHTLLLTFIASLSQAPFGVTSTLAYPSDFDSWVSYIGNTCHPDKDEDEDDDDHLPARPTHYKDDVFSKWMKAKKPPTPKKVGEYGKKVVKKYVPKKRWLSDEEEEGGAFATITPPKAKKTSKDKKDKKPKKNPKDKKDKKPKKAPKDKDQKPKKVPKAPHPSFPPPPPPKSHIPPKSPPSKAPPSPTPNPSTPTYDSDVVVVAKDGSGDFTTVQAAINSVPTNNKKRVVIFVKKGIYREKVLIPSSKPFITLKGEAAGLTYIQWGDTAATLGKDGKPLSTYGSASVAVEADDFIALDISFKNTAPPPKSGAVGAQAVALRIQGDRAAFYRCSFYGAQDTLYDREGRHYYYKCYIEGSIDFIFGDARSLFVKCHLHSIAAPFGSITAQKRTLPKENTGYSFAYCMVTGSGTIFLGRAWGPYSRVVYAFTYFDDIIVPQGWNDWNIPSNQKTVFYGEYKCYGPGANTSGRVKWSKQLTPIQAKPFLSIAFIDGKQWIPQ